jgi:hypothetical protein
LQVLVSNVLLITQRKIVDDNSKYFVVCSISLMALCTFLSNSRDFDLAAMEASGVYSIMCMKQLASSENLGELKKGAFFRSWGTIF